MKRRRDGEEQNSLMDFKLRYGSSTHGLDGGKVNSLPSHSKASLSETADTNSYF